MPPRPAKDWRAILARHNQSHVADHLESLGAEHRERLEQELEELDLPLLAELAALVREPAAQAPAGPLSPPEVRRKGEDPAGDEALRAIGDRLLARGAVACVLVAGGQGSRLKHPGPKGTYPATPVRRKTLFQLFAEKLRARSRASGAAIPLCIMTSVENDAETRAYFEEHRNFGLPANGVRFFTQGMLPAVDESGRLVMKAPHALFLSPNGHGGTLLALRTSGILDRLANEGVEHLFYFQVDNPLVDLCDPVFLGFHATEGSEFSSKVVAKSGPEEKVGVLCKQGGRMTLIEYSDLPKDLREACGKGGQLLYSAGNIATHALSVEFVKRLTDGRLRLPFHTARKALAVTDAKGACTEVPGIKFETFVFDALAFAGKAVALEVRREDEFAPIKNATGVDSPETSLALQTDRAARMLESAGVSVPRNAAGAAKVPIEISPLFATEAEELRGKIPARLSFDAPIYLGDD
jgi:UDP-N-acetylglucosamine/UDP-N-acetylgalactosamine diphosphorylase